MSDIQCAICLDDILSINDKKTLNCEHFYHSSCINCYFGTTCPICKSSFIKSNIYYINVINYKFKNVILLNNSIIKKLQNYFNFESILEFFKILNSRIIISGTFLLSIIQNSNEPNINNLDLYIDNYQEYIFIKKFLKKNNYVKSSNILIPNYLLYNLTNDLFIYKINTFCLDKNYITLVYNKDNLCTIDNNIQLDILKNYFDGNYFYIYDLTKIECKIDYINKNKITNMIKKIIQYYRNIGYKIFITD